MEDGERCVGSRYEASYLSHDGHEGDGADVSTFPAHVAACDDLEPALSRRIGVVWNILFLVYLFSDRVSSTLDGEGWSQLWPAVVLSGDQLGEGSGDVEECDGVTDLE